MTISLAKMTEKYEALEAELATAKEATREAREAAKNAKQRPRWPTGLWPNDNRRTDNDPEHQGCVRTVIPPTLQAGDYLWVDISLWIFNEETSPAHYEDNPPDYNISLSPTDSEYAEIREERRKDYFRQRAERESR